MQRLQKLNRSVLLLYPFSVRVVEQVEQRNLFRYGTFFTATAAATAQTDRAALVGTPLTTAAVRTRVLGKRRPGHQ